MLIINVHDLARQKFYRPFATHFFFIFYLFFALLDVHGAFKLLHTRRDLFDNNNALACCRDLFQ